MPKRESDSRLDDVLVGYLKRRKYRKTLELLEKTHTHEIDLRNEETGKKFFDYLKRIIKVANVKIDEDDLGFEINFGAYQYNSKVTYNHNNFITNA